MDEGRGGGSSGGSSSGSIAGGAPDRDGRSRDENVRVAQAGETDKEPVDLREEDGRLGGHTTTRHVAQPDDELLAIVRRDRIVGPTVTVARKRQGSFLTIEDANNFVNRVLEDNASAVQEVAKGEKYEAEFVKRFGYVTGKEAFRPDADAEPYMRPTYEVYVHIEVDKRSKKGYRVFRAFPINSKPNQE
ncbi:RNase A-like domain-containing protein [Hyphomicrobium sp.]|uniref:RNase A-like domain-containing protein n=1 Tax=Hyphomicrobium sp. TaxID=82 RepID=UPI003F703029